MPLVLQIFGGWLSDSIGRLRAIAIGAVGGSLGYIGMALAPTWQWAAVALALEYISGALVGPSFGAYVADQSAEDERGRAFGLVKGIFLVVAVIGPLLGGLLADRFGFKTMLSIAAAMYVSAALLRVWMALAPRFSEGKRAELPSTPHPARQPAHDGRSDPGRRPGHLALRHRWRAGCGVQPLE